MKDQYDTLRITLKDKVKGTALGSVSFDVETFRDHPVTKQWVTLFSSALSDAFKGEIGKDQRHVPRILIGYDAIPHSGEESRGKTTSKRTKETSFNDSGFDDSRRHRSARSKPPRSAGLVVKSPQSRSRVITHRETNSTKITKVAKQSPASSLRGSVRDNAKVSIRDSAKVSVRDSAKASVRDSAQASVRDNPKTSVRENVRQNVREDIKSSNSFSKRSVQITSTSPQVTRTKVTTRTSVRTLVGGFEHDDVEQEVGAKTNNLISDFNKEVGTIAAEENRIFKKLELCGGSNAKLDEDGVVLKMLRDRAMNDFEKIRDEAYAIKAEEDRKQQELLRELETLENELEDIETQLAEEQLVNQQSAGGRITVGTLEIKDEQEINSVKQETDLVLNEIRDAIKKNQIVIDESSFDPLFREDLDTHANDLIDKEKQRHEIQLDIIEMEGDYKGGSAAADINEASLNYQRSQRDALQMEYDRVTSMYDGLALDVRKELDDETRDLQTLRDYHRRLEADKNHFRLEIDHLKSDPSMTYSLDGGSVMDDELRMKVKEVEDAEKSRRAAEIKLDKLYDEWRARIDRAIDDAYVKLTAPEDRVKLQEIGHYIIENDKLTRSLNSLLSDKERIENLLYLRKTNHRLVSTINIDKKSFTSKMSSIKKEDKELMDELNKSDNALLSKNTALRELDDKIRILSRKYADLEADAQEKKALISSLRLKHDHIRLEIERLRGLINEEEIAKMELELRQKEARLKDLQVEVEEAESILVEWRERIILKQRLVKSRSQTRALLFDPDPNDPIDTRIADYALSYITTVPVMKVAKGKYLFGTRNIEVMESPSGPKVKMASGEVIGLEAFLTTFHDKEMQKLDALGDNEELVVDEKDDYKYQGNARLGSPSRSGDYSSTYRSYKNNEDFLGYDDYRESDLGSTSNRRRRHF